MTYAKSTQKYPSRRPCCLDVSMDASTRIDHSLSINQLKARTVFHQSSSPLIVSRTHLLHRDGNIRPIMSGFVQQPMQIQTTDLWAKMTST
jgi:hypothetical protein